jgi:hypothetical protein
MGGIFSQFVGVELVFFGAALIGGMLLGLRLLGQFFGLEQGASGPDLAPDNLDANMDSSDISFKLFSLQGIAGFLLMFGLVGLILIRELRVQDGWAILGAVGAGFIMALLIQKSYEFMFGMQSSGNVDYKLAVAQEGTVYLTIPQEGEGKVQIIFQNKQMVLNAVSADKAELKTGSRIRVKEVTSSNVLIVEQVS